MSTPPTLSKSFEDLVSHAYEVLGYSVRRDINIRGQQTDVIAEKVVAGGIGIRLLVEAKGGGQGPTNQQVIDFAHFVDLEKRKFGFTHGIIVSRVEATRQAKEVALAHNVGLLTLSELQSSTLDFIPYLRSALATLEDDHHQQWYIPGKCRINAGESSRRQVLPKGVYELAHVMNEFIQSPFCFLPIMGDYGSGKTTYLRNCFGTKAKEFIDGGGVGRVPLLISLKDSVRPFTYQRMMADFLEAHCRVRLTLNEFQRELSLGRFLILLDGFDELLHKSTGEVRRRHFAEIASLFVANSKTVLTSRPGYFVSDSEIDSLFKQSYGLNEASIESGSAKHHSLSARLGLVKRLRSVISSSAQHFGAGKRDVLADAVHVEEFSSYDIDLYLSLRIDLIKESPFKTSDALRRKIEQTYNLSDLSRRPILLFMIVETLCALPPESAVDAGILYQTYTGAWLDRDSESTRTLRDSQSRRKFMNVLAIEMFRTGKLSIHHSSLSIRLAEAFGVKEVDDLEALSTEIRTCTFLKRDSGGNFFYIHKSFMEFFVASELCDDSHGIRYSLLMERPYSIEILQFVGCLMMRDGRAEGGVRKQLADHSRGAQKFERDCLVGNLLTILTQMGVSIAKQDFVDLDVREVNLLNPQFRSISFHRCAFGRLVLTAPERQSHCELLFLSQSVVNGAEFSSAKLQQLACVRTRFNRGQGGCWMEVEVNDSVFVLARFEGFELLRCRFSRCVFVGTCFAGVAFSGVQFADCLFIASAFEDCTGEIEFRESFFTATSVVSCDCISSLKQGMTGSSEARHRNIDSLRTEFRKFCELVRRKVEANKLRRDLELEKLQSKLSYDAVRERGLVAELRRLHPKHKEELRARDHASRIFEGASADVGRLSQLKAEVEGQIEPLRAGVSDKQIGRQQRSILEMRLETAVERRSKLVSEWTSARSELLRAQKLFDEARETLAATESRLNRAKEDLSIVVASIANAREEVDLHRRARSSGDEIVSKAFRERVVRIEEQDSKKGTADALEPREASLSDSSLTLAALEVLAGSLDRVSLLGLLDLGKCERSIDVVLGVWHRESGLDSSELDWLKSNEYCG
jgi:uncharacterized protein YjbI with pentapeptide repeats